MARSLLKRRQEILDSGGKLPDPPKGFVYNERLQLRKVKLKPFGNIKTGLSEYQIRTNEEFMKVREGETREQWLKRTNRRRIKTREDLKVTNKGRKTLRKIKVSQKKYQSKFKTFQKYEPRHDFLKHYVAVMTYASIKFNMAKEDLEICFYFNSEDAFTKEQFDNKCKVIGLSKSAMPRFYKEGYITRIDHSNKVKSFQHIPKNHHFRLSLEVTQRIALIYKYLNQEKIIREKGQLKNFEQEVEKEIFDWLIEMNNEAKDIIAGRKLAEVIIDKPEKAF